MTAYGSCEERGFWNENILMLHNLYPEQAHYQTSCKISLIRNYTNG